MQENISGSLKNIFYKVFIYNNKILLNSLNIEENIVILFIFKKYIKIIKIQVLIKLI